MKKLRIPLLILLISVFLIVPCFADAHVYNINGSDIVVTFINGHSGSLESYADDFYDYNTFSPDGIMLIVDTQQREYYILTSGSCIEKFNDRDIYSIESKILPYLSNSNWDGTEKAFVSACSAKLYSGIRGLIYKIAGALGLGTLIGGGPLRKYKKEMETVKAKTSADDYIQPGSVALVSRQDNFRTTAISKTPIPRVEDTHHGGPGGMSGGSSVHMGSSGTMHGGHGGHF